MRRNSSTLRQANARRFSIPPILGLVIAIAILYFAREIVIPLTLALLVSFLLTPIVRYFENLRLPRPAASVATVALTFSLVAGVGWVVANQLLGTLADFSTYATNIQKRIQNVEGQSSGVTNVFNSFEQLGREAAHPGETPSPRPGRRTLRQRENDSTPVPVEIVERRNLFQTIRYYSGGILRPIGTAGLALVFTIFMLIDRENMRNRLLRLMGEQRLQATTQAMDDAAQRVSRYILMQFLVNSMFGAVTGIGLYFIGVPNWLLWGVMGLFLRFVSYVGPAVAGCLPLVVALGVSEGWRMPLSVIGLYFATELVTGNFIEPLLYGVNTGLSAVAILASAIFWTLIWGPIGLIVSTPLTVCLTVFARYSPQFQFLNVLLGDEPVLSPDAVFYQRLLALDQGDAWVLLESLLKQKGLLAIFDEVVVPALAMAERDRHSGQLEARREEYIVQSVHEMVTELMEADSRKLAEAPQREGRFLCLSAADSADEIAAAMMAHFATQEGYPAITLPAVESAADLLSTLAIGPQDVICISSVPPFAGSHARALAKQLHGSIHGATLVVGLWTLSPAGENQALRLKQAFSAAVVTSLAEALAQIRSLNRKAPARENTEVSQSGTPVCYGEPG
jgi:predicted PurR-regulated permease PerM